MVRFLSELKEIVFILSSYCAGSLLDSSFKIPMALSIQLIASLVTLYKISKMQKRSVW